MVLERLDSFRSDGIQIHRPEELVLIPVHLLVAFPGTLMGFRMPKVTLPELLQRDAYAFGENASHRFGNAQGPKILSLAQVCGSGGFLFPFPVRNIVSMI